MINSSSVCVLLTVANFFDFVFERNGIFFCGGYLENDKMYLQEEREEEIIINGRSQLNYFLNIEKGDLLRIMNTKSV